MNFLKLRWLQRWLGMNPDLPRTVDVEKPTHGMEAKNIRNQKVIWDEKQGGWVMPQDFSDRKPVTVTPNKR